MLDISKFEIMKDTDDRSVMRYSGENQYVIYQDSGYYTLSVRRPDGLEETYGCSSLSVAIASIEDFDLGDPCYRNFEEWEAEQAEQEYFNRDKAFLI